MENKNKILLYSEFYKMFGGTENIGGGLISALENQRKMLTYLHIPFTENEHDAWDILQINIPWPKSLYKAYRAKKMGKKVIMWAHVTVEDLEKSLKLFHQIPALSWLIRKYLTWAYNMPHLVLTPSVYTRNVLISYGLDPNTISVQSNGVDVKKFYQDAAGREEYRKQFKLEGVVVGNVGLVIYRKGVDTFLRIATKLSDTRFIWFGKIFSGLLVQRGGLDTPANMTFAGFVQSSNNAMNALDIFFFPSYEENQGMVILEAAAVGLPILVRDIPVYQGWLIHDVNCLKAKTDEEFEVYLRKLCTDESLRKRLSEQALILAHEESIEVQGEHLKSVYAELG
jgi:1,2-diacylglycerol-3-alpha-glucose alpha-1,2-glucosyltransferase